MFLEMIDSDKTEMIIYSQNISDPEENFRFILKGQSRYEEKKINFSDAFNFLNYPLRKSLIIYRLLTNYQAMNAENSKYGFVLLINGKNELLYFDPVYAIKDLPYLIKDFNMQSFRFKIQQLGVKTISIDNEKESFSEIYSYDLHAVEAQNQNDKIFADALSQEGKRSSKNEITKAAEINNAVTYNQTEEISREKSADEHRENSSALSVEYIKEDNSKIETLLDIPRTADKPKKSIDKSEQKQLLKKVLGIGGNPGIDPSMNQRNEQLKEEIEFDDHNKYSNLFKKTGKQKEVKEREKDSITLKLTLS